MNDIRYHKNKHVDTMPNPEPSMKLGTTMVTHKPGVIVFRSNAVNLTGESHFDDRDDMIMREEAKNGATDAR